MYYLNFEDLLNLCYYFLNILTRLALDAVKLMMLYCQIHPLCVGYMLDDVFDNVDEDILYHNI